MSYYTVVPLRRGKRVAMLEVPVRNPEEILGKVEGEGVIPFTVDLPKDDAEFLERYATYRNKFGDLELADRAEQSDEKKAKRGQTWTRKSLSEWLLRGQIELLRQQMETVEKALGSSLPKDDAAIAKYAGRAFDLKKKKSA